MLKLFCDKLINIKVFQSIGISKVHFPDNLENIIIKGEVILR